MRLSEKRPEYSERFNKAVIARSKTTCLHAEVALRLPARSRFGEGRVRRRGNLMRLLHFVRNNTTQLSSY